MSNSIVNLIKVEKRYQTGDTKVVALDTTSLALRTHQLTLIMGPSGSGKTTLISILGCIIYPDSGKVIFQGKSVSDFTEQQLSDLRLKEIGFVFQHFNLIEPLSALENIMQPLLLKGERTKEAKEKAMRLLEKLNLSNRAQNLPRTLSGGQKQRVAIARALINNPSLLLCDEPTASLDSKSAHYIMTNLKELADSGKAVVVVTHDARLKTYADSIIYVNEGKISNTPPNDTDFQF